MLKFLSDLCNRNMDIFDVIDDAYEFRENSIKEQGYGFKFIGIKDKFQPIIEVHIFPRNKEFSVSIFVENRNGNNIIYGNLIALYSMEGQYKENMTKAEIKKLDNRYRKMVSYAIEKWTKYNKENILGYVNDEDEERLEF